MTRAFLRLAPTTAAAALLASPAFAQGAKIDGADTAWMISATGLVLMMTIPGLALFYAGMVRKKNVLATMAQSLTATFLVSILWALIGYSLAFTGDGAFIGTLDRIFLNGMSMDEISPSSRWRWSRARSPIVCVSRPSCCSARSGCCSSMCRSRTGCGAAASSAPIA